MNIQSMVNNIQMPNNIGAERAILSLLTLESARIVEVVDYLSPVDFYLVTHQEIWKAMVDLYKQGQDLDIVSIKTQLIKQNIDPSPAMSDLMGCYNEPSAVLGNLRNFAKEVKNKSMLRQVIAIANRQIMDSQLEEAEAMTIITRLEKELIEVVETIKDDKPIDAQGILNEINADIAKGEENGWKGFETGFKWLDEQTGGFIPTQVWIIGAYTGVGKTFLSLQLVLNALGKGAKVMLVSTEMDRKMNMMRLIGNLAGLGTIKILKGLLEPDEKVKMLEAQRVLSNYKKDLTIYDNIYTVEEIRLKAKKKKLREGLDILFVDFIQNLRGAENIYERMSNAATELQKIAQELNITVVVASQVSQSSAGWQSKESIDYKGAGEIAAIADVDIWIKKVEDDKSVRQVVLRKVRHGIPGSFRVRMTFPSGRIIDMNEGNIGETDDIRNQL